MSGKGTHGLTVCSVNILQSLSTPGFTTETNTCLGQDAEVGSTELDYAEFREHRIVKFTESKTRLLSLKLGECATNKF